MELLKQGQYIPLPVEKQIVLIYAGTNGYIDDVPTDQITRFEEEYLRYMETEHRELMAEIVEKGTMDEETLGRLKAAAEGFKKGFVVEEERAAAD